MNEELLPCPFCGWADPVWEVERHAYDWIECAAYCANCNSKGAVAPTKKEAAEAWNKRAPVEPPDKVIHAIDRLCRVNEYHGAAITLRQWLGEFGRLTP